MLETTVGEEAFARRVQDASLRGRPLGGEEFVQELESRAGRRLRPHRVGRPQQSGPGESDQLPLGIGV